MYTNYKYLPYTSHEKGHVKMLCEVDVMCEAIGSFMLLDMKWARDGVFIEKNI